MCPYRMVGAVAAAKVTLLHKPGMHMHAIPPCVRRSLSCTSTRHMQRRHTPPATAHHSRQRHRPTSSRNERARRNRKGVPGDCGTSRTRPCADHRARAGRDGDGDGSGGMAHGTGFRGNAAADPHHAARHSVRTRVSDVHGRRMTTGRLHVRRRLGRRWGAARARRRATLLAVERGQHRAVHRSASVGACTWPPRGARMLTWVGVASVRAR